MSLVLAFLNTRDVEADTDVLRSVREWREWALDRGHRPDPLPEAVRARDTLRALVTGTDRTPGAARVTVDVVTTGDGAELVSRTAVAAVFAAVARLTALGRWNRIKICPDTACRWAFYDRSRNRSRTWCSMRVCGNRAKARSFRQRGITESSPPER